MAPAAERERGTSGQEPGEPTTAPDHQGPDTASGQPLVIGIGNPYRRDDGVGPAVIRELVHQAPPGVCLREHSGEGASLMEMWEGRPRVILVDAVVSGAAPGTVHRLEAHRQPIPASFFHYSTHAFSLAEAVELSRALGTLPPEITVYGVEGTDFDHGLGLSPPVAAAVGEVVHQILADLRRHG